jgi:hypothetical protein
MASLTSISNRKTKYGILGTIVVVVGLLVTATLNLNPELAPSKGDFGSVVYPASIRAISDSCGDIFRFTPSSSLYAEIPEDIYTNKKDNSEIPAPPMIVPVYGYMASRPLADSQIHFYAAKGFKASTIPRQLILRTMFDKGTKVIYYTDKINAGDLIAIKQYTTVHPNVLAIPWTMQEPLPLNRDIAWSTWGISQSCSKWDDSVFDEFASFVKAHPVTHEKTPRVAKLTAAHALPLLIPKGSNSGIN